MITKRGRRWLRRGVTTTIVLIVVVLAVATWFSAEGIERDLLTVDPWFPEFDLEVTAVGDGVVTIPSTADTTRPGVWGLEWDGGYGLLGDIVGVSEATVTRHLTTLVGEIGALQLVALDPLAALTEPADVGVTFRDVVFDGPLGGYPAWLTSGSEDSWVVFVHGKGSARREALRVLPVAADMGFPTLVITYRGDPEAPPDGSRHHLGETEWEDVEAAVLHALGSGAQDVVIVAYDMGAAAVSLFLHRSAWSDRVRGVIFDAPLLDPGAAVDAKAEGSNIPGFLTGLAKAIAGVRFGIEWAELDQIKRADEFSVPVLILHGSDDQIVPVEGSRRFADARPGLVDLEVFDGAGHRESWNVDPVRYEASVRAFLSEVAEGPSDLDRIVPEG